MIRVAILTRTTTKNYGTVLQAYAMQKYINKLDVQAFTIDDKVPRQIYSGNARCEEKNIVRKSIKEKIYDYYDQLCLKRQYAREFSLEKKADGFKRRYIKSFYIENLTDLEENFDVFISGSDQIWAHSAEPDLFPFFLQDFVSNGKVKASYAVSIGEKHYPQEYVPLVKELLQKMDFISAREETSREIASQYTDKRIDVVCDPVFLLDSAEWNKIAGKRKIKEKYVFCYFLSNRTWYFEKIKELSKVLQCKVYIFQKDETEYREYCKISVCSPSEFLNYICYAECILTDSFHALLFSLIFNKKVNVLERFDEVNNNVQNQRLIDLMKKFGISKYYLREKDSIYLADMDYARINQEIMLFKNESKDYCKMVVDRGKEIKNEQKVDNCN